MSIEEISVIFDYGTKEGRQMALQQLEHREEAVGKDLNETGEAGAKARAEHVEIR